MGIAPACLFVPALVFPSFLHSEAKKHKLEQEVMAVYSTLAEKNTDYFFLAFFA